MPQAPAPQAGATQKEKKGLGGRGLVALIFAVGFVTLAGYLAWRQGVFASGYVTIGDDINVRVSVAATEATRERGLSGRESLKADEGMLFVFGGTDTYAFWMKDMRFPIDILWIRNGQLVDITTDAAIPVAGQELPLYFPRVPVDHVLEVSAGFARAHGLRTGMPVAIHVDKADEVR